MTQIAAITDLSASRFSFASYAAAYHAPLATAVRRYRAQSWGGVPSDKAVEKMADRLLRDFWPTPAIMSKRQGFGVRETLTIAASWADKAFALFGQRRRRPYEAYATHEDLEAAYNEAVRASCLYIANSLPRGAPLPC